MTTVAVTGATGFIGRAIVARLAERGARVRAISRGGDVVPGAREQVACPDLLTADLAPLVAGCHAVVHCAARVHVLREDPAMAQAAHHAMNAELPLRLARAARAAGVGRFVQLSSAAAVASATRPGEIVDDATPPRPSSPYGRSKLAADEGLLAMADAGFAVVCLRPPTVYGPGVGAFFAMFDRAARLGLPLPLGSIDNRRSFAFVGNIADAAAQAADSGPTGAFIVTDSDPISTAQLYRMLLAARDRPDRVWPFPAPLVWTAARAVLRGRAASLLGDAALSGARFAREFAWTPQLPIDLAIARTVRGGPA